MEQLFSHHNPKRYHHPPSITFPPENGPKIHLVTKNQIPGSHPDTHLCLFSNSNTLASPLDSISKIYHIFFYCFLSISYFTLVRDPIVSGLNHCRSLSQDLYSRSCFSHRKSSPHTVSWLIFLKYRFGSDLSCLKDFSGFQLYRK